MATIRLGNESLTIITDTMEIHIENASRHNPRVAYTIVGFDRKPNVILSMETNYSIHELCVKADLRDRKISKKEFKEIEVLDVEHVLKLR